MFRQTVCTSDMTIGVPLATNVSPETFVFKGISIHAVENLVEKYTKEFIPQKKITPHKLRSTFGTSLYRETGDIYLVADVLGLSDVGTTRKHYAALDGKRRRMAASAVKLRGP